MYINSTNNTKLGAWFVASEQHYRALPFPSPVIDISTALTERPTVLFLHGRAGHRAWPGRVRLYGALSARLHVNVLAIDYRGFGDSSGAPTLQGVADDARAAWDGLIALGAAPADVLIVGTSLGCSIASLLAADLGAHAIRPRGLVLLSPFASAQTVMYEFYLFGFLPLLKPLVRVPALTRFISKRLMHRFDTVALVPKLLPSVLIVHAENDRHVLPAHSDVLFNAFIEPLFPLPLASGAGQQAAARSEIVTALDIPGLGTLEEAQHQDRRLALLKTRRGGHGIGSVEGVQDVIGRMFGLIQ
ncbi:Alpha/Beta hydrolase protein [Mycena belliarum]|uniref:Alpha/Beta hydrolase protein n=1 Tax=Mycena belliarum TaxID=1033014 RepID=A0AAD6UGW6_9AGAR|nr:Alpha/Beta hydrolase protein [Mycena belliae]